MATAGIGPRTSSLGVARTTNWTTAPSIQLQSYSIIGKITNTWWWKNTATSSKVGEVRNVSLLPKSLKIAIIQNFLFTSFSFCKQCTLSSLMQFSNTKLHCRSHYKSNYARCDYISAWSRGFPNQCHDEVVSDYGMDVMQEKISGADRVGRSWYCEEHCLSQIWPVDQNRT